MFPFWIIFGVVIILLGIFNKQALKFLGLKPMSEVFTSPSLKHSSQRIEKLGQWLLVVLGVSFFVHGLGEALPNNFSYKLSFSLLGLAGLMILAMIGITLMTWRAK